jgi:hypothetical protein
MDRKCRSLFQGTYGYQQGGGKIRAWSKLKMLANFWPGCNDLMCVTEDLNQTIFIRLFVSCFISRSFLD